MFLSSLNKHSLLLKEFFSIFNSFFISVNCRSVELNDSTLKGYTKSIYIYCIYIYYSPYVYSMCSFMKRNVFQ